MQNVQARTSRLANMIPRAPRGHRLEKFGLNLQAIAAEAIGCMWIAMTVSILLSLPPAATGLGVMWGILSVFAAFITMFGNVSGGHFNPAVSLTIAVSGSNKLHWKNLLCYFVVQFIMGFLGALLGGWLAGDQDQGSMSAPNSQMGPKPFAYTDDVNVATVVIMEILYTTALCYMVECVQLAGAGGATGGLFVALMITAAANSIGPIEGCCINPMLALGINTTSAIYGRSDLKGDQFCLYLFAPFVGSPLAAIMFHITHFHLYDHSMGLKSLIPPLKAIEDEAQPATWRKPSIVATQLRTFGGESGRVAPAAHDNFEGVADDTQHT